MPRKSRLFLCLQSPSHPESKYLEGSPKTSLISQQRLGISCYGAPRDLHSLDPSHSHWATGTDTGNDTGTKSSQVPPKRFKKKTWLWPEPDCWDVESARAVEILRV